MFIIKNGVEFAVIQLADAISLEIEKMKKEQLTALDEYMLERKITFLSNMRRDISNPDAILLIDEVCVLYSKEKKKSCIA